MGAAGLHLTQDSAAPFVFFIIWHFLQNCIFFFDRYCSHVLWDRKLHRHARM